MLGRRVGGPRPGAAEPRHQGSEDSISRVAALGAIRARHLDLDLTEAGCDAPAIPHRDLVVHHLCHACSRGVDQPDAASHRRQPGYWHELGLADVSTHDLQRSFWRFGRPSLKGELVAFEHRPGLAWGRRRLCELERPPFSRPTPQRDAPSRQTQVCRVVINRLHTHGFRRSHGDTFDDSGEVGEVERGTGPELHLTLDQRPSNMRDAVRAVAVRALDCQLLEAVVRVEPARGRNSMP